MSILCFSKVFTSYYVYEEENSTLLPNEDLVEMSRTGFNPTSFQLTKAPFHSYVEFWL